MAQPRWVLVVDDDPIGLGLLSEWLEERGLRVTTAADALQAVIQARDLKPVLIITDLMMPVWGSGGDALKNMRADPVTKDAAVIILTGALPQQVDEMVRHDARMRVLYKPVDLAQLARTITELTGIVLKDPAKKSS